MTQPFIRSHSVIHILSGDLLGGSEAQMISQLPALKAEGCDVTAVLFNDLETAKQLRESGIPVTILSEAAGIRNLVSGLRQLLRTVPTTAVVAHGYKESIVAALASLGLPIPLVRTYHGLTEKYRGVKQLKIFAYELLERIICSQKFVREVTVNRFLATALGIADKKTTRVIYNVGRVPSVASDFSFHSRPAFVIVGRLVPVKRVDRAIAAMNLYATVSGTGTLCIIGDGPERKALEQLAKVSLGDISFVGFRADASGIIGQADVLLITSDSEGLPTVLLEAMLSGTKIVSVDLPGIREIGERFQSYPLILVEHSAAAVAEGMHRVLTELAPPSAELLHEIRNFASPARAARDHVGLLDELAQAK